MHLASRTGFVAFLVTAVFGFGDNFYTLTNVTSWEEANRTCTLATPRIHYTWQGLILDFGDGLDGVIGQYWVGYTTYNHLFQYIGCSDEAYVAGLATGYSTIPSPRPGVCYSACGTDLFGVRDEHCYCIPYRLNRDYEKQTCTRSCTHPGIQCGGESAVSIFEVADPTMFNFTRYPKGTEYCIAYDVRKQAFIWEDCDGSSRSPRCKPPLGHKLMTSRGRKRRGDTADGCILRRNTNTLPLDDDNADLYWTGYFRTDDCIRTFNDRATPVHFGHVNIQDKKGQQELRFGRDKTDFDAICEGKPASTMLTTTLENMLSSPDKQASAMFTTPEESTISTPGEPATTMFTKTEISITTTPGIQAPTMSTTTQESIATTQGKQSPTMFAATPGKPASTMLTRTEINIATIPAYQASTMFTTTAMERNASTPGNEKGHLPIQIGLSLLILACVAVVVVCVICCRRRRSNIKPSTPAPNIVEHYSQVQDPYDDAQNVYNEPFDNVIERKTNTNKHGHDNRSMPNDESEYDTTCVVGKSATERKVGDNVYNTLELVTDDTYDHVKGPNNKRDTRVDKPGSSNAKAGYVIVAENTYDRVDIEEGSYSHVNAGKRTPVASDIATVRKVGDNVYNTPELVTDDTYDHVNGPKGQRDTRADKPGSRNPKAGYGIVAENTYDRVDADEGSYSYVNADIHTPETTDNVYN